MGGWIGVDLDGTLAEFYGWTGGIGKPVPAMLERVKDWLARGVEVRIMTARVSPHGGYSSESGRNADDEFVKEQRSAIDAWCLEHIGEIIPVTHVKDFRMIELWDDRAVQVRPNTGERVDADYPYTCCCGHGKIGYLFETLGDDDRCPLCRSMDANDATNRELARITDSLIKAVPESEDLKSQIATPAKHGYETFTEELNRLLAEHGLRLDAGQAETEGLLILEEIQKGDSTQEFAIRHHSGYGGFFTLEDANNKH